MGLSTPQAVEHTNNANKAKYKLLMTIKI
jgi:hypothetical protein